MAYATSHFRSKGSQVGKIRSIIINLSSPEEILAWSRGEVIKPETINYRTQRAEREGLFSEKIFGPVKDYECYCGKYKGVQYKGITCDRCGVELTHSSVRRFRMGHIRLAAPVVHPWFLRVYPYPLSLFLDIPVGQLEKVIYYSAYIITRVDEEAKRKLQKDIEADFQNKMSRLSDVQAKNDVQVQYKKILEELQSLRPKQVLTDLGYYTLSHKYGRIFEVGIGAEPIRQFLEEVNLLQMKEGIVGSLKNAVKEERKKLVLKLKFVNSFIKHNRRPEWMFLTALPVLPPDLRPMVQLDGGKFASSDLNDLYRRVINRNNRLKKLYELRAPAIIVRNEKRMLQEAVDALIDNALRRGVQARTTSGQRRTLKSLADILRGKQGRFRQNLLGKRVDYSGRSVIVVGPDLKLHECGLPKRIALELFRPFIIRELMKNEVTFTIKHANYLIESETPEALNALESVIRDRYILLNRAPTLHRLGFQAFKPILIEGLAVQVHPLVCAAYNADFDGDQMAVHLPLSEDAQKEARDLMLSAKNLLKPGTGEPITTPTKDIVFGCFFVTQVNPGAAGEGMRVYDATEAKLLWDYGVLDLQAALTILHAKGLSEPITTSVGRIIFNEVLPDDFPYLNEEMTNKKLAVLVEMLHHRYGREKTALILDRIKAVGFSFATLSGVSWGMDDLLIPEEKSQILKETERVEDEIQQNWKQGLLSDSERRLMVIEVWLKAMRQLGDLIKKVLPQSNAPRAMVTSGSRGSWTQLVQMTGMKGLVEDPRGEVIELPIKSSYKEGLGVLEYFIATHGARKGSADTALKTSRAGYLTRRMVDVAQDVIVRAEDCGDTKGIVVSRTEAEAAGEEFSYRIFSRVAAEDVVDSKGDLFVSSGAYIDREGAARVQSEASISQVRVRSPLTCRTLFGVCAKCYGWDLSRNQPVQLGETVGIIAAQAIGEPGVQLTMRTFHIGGVAGAADITRGIPRVEEIFELRVPKQEGVMSPVSGKVESVKRDVKAYKLTVALSKKERVTVTIPVSQALLVKQGTLVAKGERLSEGAFDPKKIYTALGQEEAAKYLINEIKKVYNFQGAAIHDKHVEIIARKMFSRVRVKDAGDSAFVEDDILEKDLLDEVNQGIEAEGKRSAKWSQLLMGITRVALTTYSFLAAASFQETARVLVKASLEGREDQLRGLKENVILGRKIPAGTSFRKSEEIVETEQEAIEVGVPG